MRQFAINSVDKGWFGIANRIYSQHKNAIRTNDEKPEPFFVGLAIKWSQYG